MRIRFGMAMLVAAFVALPAYSFAAQASKPAAKPASTTKAKDASHATTGVVKSIDTRTMVITRSGKQKGEMTFDMSSSPHRDGTIEVGSPVSVRYRDEGVSHVATAITLQHQKHSASHSTTKS